MNRLNAACWIAPVLMTLAMLSHHGAPMSMQDAAAMDEFRESLLNADRQWGSVLHDREAFAEFIAPDVYFLPPDVPMTRGKEAFLTSRDMLVEMNLTWTPQVAEVSGGGDLGVTIGSFQITVEGADGEPVKRVGKYQTTWKRGDDGRWRVIADMFNFDAPMPEPGG